MENQHRKIRGYRELDQAEIDLMNEIKQLGAEIESVVNRVRATDHDGRWAAIGVTDLQTGLMALTRAVAQPEAF